MFGFLKKKADESINVLAPCSGTIVDVTDVPDEVFSGLMMGDGMAVWQEDAEVCAPVDGVLTMVADTKHAFGITTANDAQILVHVGLETVELGGEGFEQVRSQGEQVKAGDVILKVDLALMKEKGIAMAVPVLLIPEDEERTLKKTEAKKAIGHETLLFQVS